MNDKNTDKRVISKPITVLQTELANKIVADINEANLHPVIIMPVIEEIYDIMKNILKETREREKLEYEKSINESNMNDESK